MRNVVLLVLDSVRKDFFDQYATRLQARADVAVAHARAPSSWPVPSHASLFTGELPSEHGVHTYSRSFETLDPERVFHTRLPHASVGVSANAFAGSPYDFDRYFDAFADVTAARRYPNALSPADLDAGRVPGSSYLRYPIDALTHDRPIESLKNGAAAFLHARWRRLPGSKLVDDSGTAVLRHARTLASETTEPWFLFLNLMDAHIPLQHFRGLDRSLHEAHTGWSSADHDVWELFAGEYPEYWRTRESVYGAYVEYLDRLVTRFVDRLQRETTRETTVVVTADHGENHGEPAADGLANHKSSLSEPLLDVPLLVLNAPSSAVAPEGIVSLLDLPDLTSALAHDEWTPLERDVVPAELLGMSAGPDPPDEMDDPYYRRAIRVCYRGETKYEWDSLGNARRYELDANRPSWQPEGETGVSIPAWALDQFDTPLDAAVEDARAGARAAHVGADVEARLRDLGYR